MNVIRTKVVKNKFSRKWGDFGDGVTYSLMFLGGIIFYGGVTCGLSIYFITNEFRNPNTQKTNKMFKIAKGVGCGIVWPLALPYYLYKEYENKE